MGIDKTIISTFLIIALAFVGLLLAIFGSRVKEGISAKSMYNIAGCLVIASIISCAISFFAIVLALEKGNTNNIYQQDVIVDIFAVLVTVLMGWNIISVVDIKRNAEKVNSISNDLEMVISSIIQLNFHSLKIKEDKKAVIHSCFTMLEEIISNGNTIVGKSAEKEIIKILCSISRSYEVDEPVYIYNGMLKKYQYILNQTDNIDKIEIEEKMLSNPIESGSFNKDDSLYNDTESSAKVIDYNYIS